MTNTTRASIPLLITLFATNALAQGTGRISGVVRDPAGAVIADAQVEVSCGATLDTITTSGRGEFTKSGLPDGRCRVTARSDAFEPESIEVGTSGRPVTLVLRIRPFAQEVVVTPARGTSERASLVPESVSVTSRRDIDSRPFQLLPQVLQEEPGVLVQQTSSAQTSPIIRGFTGQGNVYLLDGARLNVSSWRSGPSQYTAWVDPGPIESIEVVRGGGSVQYGSDALGGTIQFLSGASLASRRGAPVRGTVSISGATANEAVTGRADLGAQMGRAALRFGLSRTDVGDLRAGGGIDSRAAVTRFLGLPSAVVGSTLPQTGFEQSGAYLVGTVSPGRNATLRGIYMHESQDDVSRYDRILGGEGLFSSGFTPQKLDFGVLRYEVPDVAGLDGISAAFSVNRQGDGRFEQARPNARLDRQTNLTVAYGYQAQAHKALGSRQQFVAGTEFYDESIGGERQLIDPVTGTTPSRPDIPDGTTYSSFGAFAQHSADIVPNRVTLRGGLRASSFRFATRADQVLGVVDERVSTNAVTFQGSAVVRLTDGLNVTANVSRGFRAANAADLGNIGLTGGGGFEITPSRGIEMGALVGSTGAADARSTGGSLEALRPEVVYQYDLGIKGQAGKFNGAVNVFNLELHDFIQRRSLVFTGNVVGTTIAGFQIVRQDAFGLAYIAQDVRPIASRVNVDRGRINGFDAVGDVRFNRAWSASAFFSMANGHIIPTGAYVRRMPPPMGQAKVRWQGVRVWAEGVMNVAMEQTRLDSGDLSDARIGAVRTRASIGTFFNGTATDMGLVRNGVLVETGETLAAVQNRVLGTAASGSLFTSHPGYAVLSLRGGINLGGGVDVSVIGENLADKNYRLYGSGLDAPGRSFHARVGYRF